MSPALPEGQAEARLRLRGVSLAQYAAVNAALAEELPLVDVLAIEAITSKAWPHAALAWRQRLVEDTTGTGGLFDIYRRELATAEDRLARRVAPLDDDVAAWVSFLHAYAHSPAPFDWLKRLGLGMNDVSRLQRRWAIRLERDAALQRQAAKLQEKEPFDLPRITAEPAQLPRPPATVALAPKRVIAPAPEPARTSPAERLVEADATQPLEALILEPLPFRTGEASPLPALESARAHAARIQGEAEPSHGAGATAELDAVDPPSLPFAGRPEPSRGADEPDLTLQQYAALCVELHRDPERVAETLARHGLTSGARTRLDARWQRRFIADPALRSDYLRAYDGARGNLLRPAAAPPGAARQASAHDRTQPMPALGPDGAEDTLPFEQPLDSMSKPSLTLEQYAWLCSELLVHPERKAEILRRYGLGGDPGKHAEDAAWQRRLRGGGAIDAQWRRLVAACCQWLVQRPRP